MRRCLIVAVLALAALNACGEDPQAPAAPQANPEAKNVAGMWNEFRAAAKAKDFDTICREYLTEKAAIDYITYYGHGQSCRTTLAHLDLFNGNATLSGLKNIRLSAANSMAAGDYNRSPAPSYRDGSGMYSVQLREEQGGWRIHQLFGDFVNND